mmetsp:Transcript_1915/g.3967  ORF Transcript_1915/g.3967 Transcript_1915/m.3967 type:complete len:390 (+) Transcript_1915:430-1599(+)
MTYVASIVSARVRGCFAPFCGRCTAVRRPLRVPCTRVAVELRESLHRGWPAAQALGEGPEADEQPPADDGGDEEGGGHDAARRLHQNLGADENEHHAEHLLHRTHVLCEGGEHEVDGPQREQRHREREHEDEGRGGDGEQHRRRVHGEDHVGERDAAHDDEQTRRAQRAILVARHVVAVGRVGPVERHERLHAAQRPVRRRVDLLFLRCRVWRFVRREHELEPSAEKKDAEEREEPRAALEDGGAADEDEHANRQRRHHPVGDRAQVVRAVELHLLQQKHEHEEVVAGEHRVEDEAAEKQHALRSRDEAPEQRTGGHDQPDPHERPSRRRRQLDGRPRTQHRLLKGEAAGKRRRRRPPPNRRVRMRSTLAVPEREACETDLLVICRIVE